MFEISLLIGTLVLCGIGFFVYKRVPAIDRDPSYFNDQPTSDEDIELELEEGAK